jgi:hypothetical protein
MRRRRRTGAPQQLSKQRMILMAVALLLIGTFGAAVVGRLLLAPWSIGFPGRETLTGPWAGSLKTPNGAEFGLLLDLEYKERSGRGVGGSNNLQGRATLCTPKGERYDFEVEGQADPLGGIEKLWLEYGDPRLSGLGLQLTGAWRGGALHFTTTDQPYLGGRLLAAPTSSGNDPVDPDDYFAPATLTERDRAAFEATCRRIRAG